MLFLYSLETNSTCGNNSLTPYPVVADKGGRILADVAVGDRVVRSLGQPLADKALAEIAAVRAVQVLAGKAGAGADVELKNVRHGKSPEVEFI